MGSGVPREEEDKETDSPTVHFVVCERRCVLFRSAPLSCFVCVFVCFVLCRLLMLFGCLFNSLCRGDSEQAGVGSTVHYVTPAFIGKRLALTSNLLVRCHINVLANEKHEHIG